MAVTTFIPEVWAAQLQVALQKSLVTGQPGVINRDYEGDIANFGDTVNINALGAITIDNYVKNVTAIAPETLATTSQALVIDQAKFFAFEVDDIDKRQARSGDQLLTKGAGLAASGLATVLDTYLMTLMSTQAGTILTPEAINTQDGAFLLLRRLDLALNKKNVPSDGRWVIISPELKALLLGDARFIDTSRYGSSAPIMNGEIGQALGFRVLVSNNSPAGTAAIAPIVSNFVFAGHGMATTLASQIGKVEAFRPESAFSDAIKGLNLYGAKVTEPDALVAIDLDVTVV